MSGALANLTLSKRSAILDKSVNETLKGSLMNSPLTDKIFGLSLQKVQEEVSKAPQSVSVNVRLNDGKRTIASSSSGYQPTPTFLQKGERLFVANSMQSLLKHLMLRSLVLCPLVRYRLLKKEGNYLFLPSLLGERLSQFSTQWEKRTSNPWVLSIIRGGDQNFSSNSCHLCRSLPFSFQSLRILTNVNVCQRKCLFCCRRQQ